MKSHSRPELCSFKNSSKSGIAKSSRNGNPTFLWPVLSYLALEGHMVSLTHLCHLLIK